MPGPIHLFVSSSLELQLEREVVGQTVAQLPLTIGWQIDHTPQPGAPATEDLSRVASSDLCILILGHDFSAPIGAELRQLRQVGRHPLAYRKRCTRSPSSQDAIRRLALEWRAFSDPGELRPLFRRDLLRALLQRADEFGLDMQELEQLLQIVEEESGERENRTEEGSGRGEAGRSGVILGREIWEGER
jgi:hypothetical protein